MKQIIQIHVGQAGVQLGNACWELYCIEHGIQVNGKPHEEMPNIPNNDYECFFTETQSGQYVPRAILFDLEPTVIDEVRTGEYKQLFNPKDLITGKEDCGNIWTRGAYTTGREYIDKCTDRLRNLVENCDQFQGFLITHALGGGTGSGFQGMLLSKISIDFPKKLTCCLTIYPSPRMSNTVVEPYNCMLGMNQQIEESDMNILFDNEALYDICEHNLGQDLPNYKSINRLIAQVISSQTASMRFNGSLNVSLRELALNLIPYPRLHFLVSSFAPFLPFDQQYQEQKELSVSQLTNLAFEKHNMLVKCDPRHGKYMACSMIYRGDIVPSQAYAAIINIKSKNTIEFVDWCPTGFKVGITSKQCQQVPDSDLAKLKNSVMMIANTTAIESIFSKVDTKFDKMYAKRSFVHWFVGEGMEEHELSRARESMAALEIDYRNVETDDVQENQADEE